MIQKIIQLADIHIPNLQKKEEYSEGLANIIETCREQIGDTPKEDCRIIICGDLVHQKNQICNELLTRVAPFLRDLETLCTVYVIAGNHDFVETNSSRVDTLSALFLALDLKNTIFLDGYFHNTLYGDENMLDGDVTTPFSGLYEDDNVVFALYSIMGEGKYKYENPFLSERTNRADTEGKTIIGLFHGEIAGAASYSGMELEAPIKLDTFNKCDIVMAGDNHKRQILYHNDLTFVYSGSPMQQDFGESVLEHGLCLWKLTDGEYEPQFIDIKNTFGYYKMEINDLSDFEEDKEQLKNYS